MEQVIFARARLCGVYKTVVGDVPFRITKTRLVPLDTDDTDDATQRRQCDGDQPMECRQYKEGPKNSMIITRQWILCEMRKRGIKSISGQIFKSRLSSRFTDGNWVDRREGAEIWINEHWKTSLTRLSEENAQDTGTPGSCLSTPRGLCHRWTQGTTTRRP